jgi:hypothetical protein
LEGKVPAVRQTIGYFQSNRERMRYAQFRRQQVFVGSSVIEAGCKTIVGYRLKQSGMRSRACAKPTPSSPFAVPN